MPGDGEKVDAEPVDLNRDLPDRLGGVGMHERSLGMRRRGDIRDRHDGARLVVREHDRHDGRVAPKPGLKLIEQHASRRIDRDAIDLEATAFEPDAGRFDRRMLDDRGHQVSPALDCLENAADRKIVRLRSARGEDHLLG